MNIVRLGCLALPAVLLACSSVAPIKVAAGDQCFRCRRYISNERVATETIDSNRFVSKFRGPGCMAKYLVTHPDERPIIFVTDYTSGSMIAPEAALYVPDLIDRKTAETGLRAFRNPAHADAFAAGGIGGTDHLGRGPRPGALRARFKSGGSMQTLFEWGFILGLILPPAAIVAGACATLGPSFVYWRSHAGERGVTKRWAVALHHRFGRRRHHRHRCAAAASRRSTARPSGCSATPRRRCIGRNVSMLMPSPYHEEHDGYLARYLSTGEREHHRHRPRGHRPAQGRVDVPAAPVGRRDADVGGERKFTGMLHDLTDRVQLEERLRASEARWRAIVESAVDGIVVIDAHGRIEAFNPAAERLFGYAERDVIGQNVNMLMPSPYPRGARRLSRALSRHRRPARSSASAARSPAAARTARRFRCTCRSAR